MPVKNDYRTVVLRSRSFRRKNSFGELLWMLFQPQIAKQLLGADATVSSSTPERRQRPSRTNNGVEQPACGSAIPKFQPVRNEPLDSQMLRQGPHNVIQALAHKNDLSMLGQPLAQLCHAFGPELPLEYILEVL